MHHWWNHLFKHAIVRQIADSYTSCISSHPLHNQISIERAQEQHTLYINTLKDLGLEAIVLPPLNDFPDSCFVEDTAIIHKSKAVITRMGASTRRGEGDTIAEFLKDYFQLSFIKGSATIEGGDVIHLPNKLLSGISQRTNSEGVSQTSSFLNVQIDTIIDPTIIHLKSHISYLNDESLLVCEKYVSDRTIEEYDKIIVPQSEEYATNTLSINGTIIMAKGFQKTLKLLQENYFDVIVLETSEIEKCQGALTCMSLLF